MTRLRRLLVPPLRHPLRWTAFVPLAAAGLLLGSGLLFVQRHSLVVFSNPSGLWLLLALPWLWWLHLAGFSALSGPRRQLALACRLLLATGLAILLAAPRAVRHSNHLSIMYALDLSDSLGDTAVDGALGYVLRTATEKPPGDEAGLVVLARNAGIELPCRSSFPFEAINSRIARDGTNLEQGLALAAALLPEENQGRIVLISDGCETEGRVERILELLQARNVPIDVLPVEYAHNREVWLEKLDLPQRVKAGETYEASVILSSLTAGSGTLVLRENDQEICREDVRFESGKNRFVLPLSLRRPGYYEYAASIHVPNGEDGRSENNVAINDLYLQGEGRVLLVTDPTGDPRDWDALTQALQESERQVEICSAYQFPRHALSLLPYDVVVVVNVPADCFDPSQLAALRDTVHAQGTGFLMVGGRNSYGPGGYHRSPVEDILPVSMDITQRRVLPRGALAIILHTCEFAEGNAWGKRIAKEAVRVLGAEDEVGCLAFDWQGADNWVFPLTPAREYETLVRKINQAQIGDMPDFGTTMRLAQDALEASTAAAKHVIIISDGDPSPPPPELLQQFVSARISVSTVAINPHSIQDTAIMQSIAETTGGRYYFPQDPELLPQIFIREATTLRRSLLQNRSFVPEIGFPSTVLKGIDSVPQLHGLVLTTPKARAEVILLAPGKDDTDPVLATWRQGLGRTAAFTSDLSANWGRDWLQWQRFRAFVHQLTDNIARVEQRGSLLLSASAAGSYGVISIDDTHPHAALLDLQVQVAGPHGRVIDVNLQQSGPQRYQGRFELWGQGRYRVSAAGSDGTRNEQALAGFALPYSPEYLRLRSNPIMLARIAHATGGRLLHGRESGRELFVPERTGRSSSRSLVHLLLTLLACLVPLDVALRRIQLDWGALRRRFAWTAAPKPDSTLRTLLQRKQDRRTQTPARSGRQEPATDHEPLPQDNAERAAAHPRDHSDSGSPSTPHSTTARLLARKHRWKPENKP